MLVPKLKKNLNSDVEAARLAALRFLMRREHSQLELTTKLQRHEFSKTLIQSTVEALASEGLQSDQRFAEAYLRYRSQRGFGPFRIEQELSIRGVSGAVIQQAMLKEAIDWDELIVKIYRKQFGETFPQDVYEKKRRQNFLKQRGFSNAQIAFVLLERAQSD